MPTDTTIRYLRPGKLTYAGTIQPGDQIRVGDTFTTITKIRKAQGRKPKHGENLHLLTADTTLRYNSNDPVRVRRATNPAQ